MNRARRGPGPWAATAALALSLSLQSGCTSSGPTPEQARRDRVEARLQATFTTSQTSCILGRSDDRLLTALDEPGPLPADGAVMDAYTNVLVACAADEDAPTTATTEGTPP